MVSRRHILVIAAVCMALSFSLLAGCGAKKEATDNKGATTTETKTETGSIAIEGSDTMVNLAQAWAESYMQANPNVMITVKGGGSGAGIASLLNGGIDFADASREAKDDEKAAAKTANAEFTETPVARDGIAVIVNSANKVKDLSTDQLGKIYRGEITDWKEVGGEAGKIVLLGRDTSSGTYEFFLEAVVGKDNKYATSMRSMQSSQAIVDEVKNNPNAIGYVGMGYEDPETVVLNVDGKAATVDAVQDGSYTLSRNLYMDSLGAPKGVAQTYLEWILSDEGQNIVEQQGFVKLK